MKKTLFIILLSILIHQIVYPGVDESLIFKQISTKEGLSQNTVRTIHVDNRGFIWAGTLDGLNRYDGSRFITYKPQIGEKSSISDHRIRNLFEDKDGFLWIKKYDNTFSCYNPGKEIFLDLIYKNKTIPLSYTDFIETSEGSIWLWNNKTGCVRITKKTGKPEVAFIENLSTSNLSDYKVEFIFEDSKKNIWIGCQNGLNLITPDNSIYQHYNNNSYSFKKAIEMDNYILFITTQNNIVIYNNVNNKFSQTAKVGFDCNFTDAAKLNKDEILLTTRSNGLISYNVRNNIFNSNPLPDNSDIKTSAQLITDKNGDIWIYDHTGVLRHYLSKTGKIRKLRIIPQQIASVIDNERYVVFIDSHGIYWITTYGYGLFKYDYKTGDLCNFRYNLNSNSPASDYLLSIAEDKSGNLWIGSEYAGIIKVVRQNYKIKRIKPEPEDIPGSSNNVKVVFEDSQEKVWVGTKNGSLYLYDKQLKSYSCIRKNFNPYTIIEDHKNRIWIGTKGNGVYVYDLSGSKELLHFENDQNNPGSLSNNSIFNILQDRNNHIWIASFGGGLDLYNEINDKDCFTHFFYDEGNKSFIRYLYQDSHGQIWTGSYEGLICFTPEVLIHNPENYKIYRYSSNNGDGLNCNDIKTIFEDSRGQMWIGTAGGGLNLLVENGNSEDNEKFIKYTTRQGLPSDVITAIMESRDSVLWISTENGISQYNNLQKSFMTYLFSERTQGNYYSENACALRKNGEMLWGTLDGLIAFDPGKFVKNNFAPSVVFTDLFIYDQRVETDSHKSPLSESISMVDNINLTHDQNTFTIHFACLNLTDPKMNKYTYIMEPFDKYWSVPGSVNSATYKNLPPGTYTFKVKGSNSDDQWNNKISKLQIVVIPPFWKSKVALIIYFIVIIILLILIFGVIFKISNLNNAVRIEKQLTDYKLRFFTNISHEFRTPLTLIRGSVESLSEEKGLSDSGKKQIILLNRNARQMTRLIDQLLEFRKIQNNVLTLNLELTEIAKYTLDIYYEFKEIASHKNIDYKYYVNPEKWDLYIDNNKVEKIIFNLLSNAFKFTPVNGKIELSVEKNIDNNSCVISVKDSGIGIPKEKQNMLFSRFMQVHFSSEGTGVGLSLVKEFTDAHKGKVWFEENPEGGSVFRVELPASTSVYKDAYYISQGSNHAEPLIPDNEHENYQTDKESIKGSSPHEWRILIIDDNKDIRDFLCEELGKHFITETAENGIIGVEMAIANNPDLIISDVKMPEMDGFEVTSRLKNEFQTSHIPIILLTALSSDAVILKGSECGADAYIMKPFSLKYLLSRVYKLIEQREMLKKCFSIDIDNKEKILSNSNTDKEFYMLINEILDKNIGNPSFTVEEFNELSGQKRTVFYKKIKGLTGYSPNELIKIKRMKRAAELLIERKHTVSEVAYKIGIEDPFYFSKCFKSQFGCSPSKYCVSANNEIVAGQNQSVTENISDEPDRFINLS